MRKIHVYQSEIPGLWTVDIGGTRENPGDPHERHNLPTRGMALTYAHAIARGWRAHAAARAERSKDVHPGTLAAESAKRAVEHRQKAEAR